MSQPILASSKHTPLRYTDSPRRLKHAGTLSVSSKKSDIMILNYRTGAGANYKTGALCDYSYPTGYNYKPATNLRYR